MFSDSDKEKTQLEEKERKWKLPLIIFLFALVVRFLYLLEIDSNPFFDFPVIDADTYLRQAKAIAGGDLLGESEPFDYGAPFWQAPGYPYLLSVLIMLFGVNFYVLRGFGLLLGALNCLLVCIIGNRVFNRSVGIISGVISALWGPFIFFDAELLPVTPLITLSLLAIYASLSGSDYKRLALAGLFVGGGAVVYNSALALAIAIFIKTLLAPLKSRTKLKMLILFCLTTLLPIVPVTVRNVVVGGDMVLISYNMGVNFYIGNHPEHDRLIRARPLETKKIEADPAYVKRPSDNSKWFFRKTIECILQDPSSWAKLMVKKTGRYFNGWEILRNQDPYYFRQYSYILKFLLWDEFIKFPLGVMFPLAIIGISIFLFARRYDINDRGGGYFLLFYLVLFSIAIITFFVTSRYRLPAVPILILFGSWALVIALKNLRLGKYKAVVIGFIAFIVLVGFCNWEKFKYNPTWAGETEYFLGLKQFETGNYAKARGYFLTALEYNPDNPLLLKYLGYIDAATGNELQALVWYEKLLAHDKSDRIIYLNRGIILSNMGRYKEAEQNYKEAMELFPDWDVPPKKLEELTPFLKRK